MKTVTKCFLAMLSTASMVVAASEVQAQSLPGGLGLNSAAEASAFQPGGPGTAVPRSVADARDSAFAVDGNAPFNPIREPMQQAASDGKPPVVRAPHRVPPEQSFAAPQNIGMTQLPAITPAANMPGGQPIAATQSQLPQPAAQVATNNTPLAYMPAAGVAPYSNYGVAPAGYAAPQGFAPQGYGAAPSYASQGYGAPPSQFGQPPVGYGQPAFQMQPAGYSNPGMNMGYPQGQPQADGWGSQASYGPPKALPPGIGGMAGPAGQPGGQSFCGECGGGGCANCGFGGGFGGGGDGSGVLANLLGRLLPYSEGGQCAPRWYDITLDGMYLQREKTSRRVDFTADGPGPGPNVIMSTDDLDFEEQPGVRLNAAIQVLSTATAEFTYFGLFSWSDSDSRSEAAGGLFSPVSQFATFPPGGFPQTDNAIFHSIAYSSSFDNFEMNFRRRWSAPNCRVQASFLMGVRYLYLLEDFQYFTQGRDDINPDPLITEPGGTLDYNIRARNSLTGFQLGGDLWSSIVPGVKAGGELKAGVFGNYGNQMTVIDVTEPDNQFVETAQANDIAFITDANLMVIWRVNPNWTLRAGYFMMYVDGVLLAPEQFNAAAPPNLQNPSLRTLHKNDNGSAFYHGGFAGLEWQW